LTGFNSGPAFSFTPISPDSNIYQQSGDVPQPFFFAAIQDCSFNTRSSAATAARQLLVGLEKIEILERSSIRLAASDLLRTKVTAELEGRSLDLISYTRKDGRCVQDYILWRRRAQKDSPGVKASELHSFEKYLGSILPKETASAAR
jgi:hypothetical protein